MKKIFQLSQAVVVMVMSVFLFSCEKSEMDGVVPSAQAEAKKDKNNSANTITPSSSQQADTMFIVTFYDPNNTLNSEVAVQNLATTIGGAINFEQTYWEGTKGFAAPLTTSQANTFRHDSRVEFVEVDGPIYPTNP